jgi:hypothetical protein
LVSCSVCILLAYSSKGPSLESLHLLSKCQLQIRTCEMVLEVLWTHSLSEYILYSQVVINNYDLQIHLSCILWLEIMAVELLRNPVTPQHMLLPK